MSVPQTIQHGEIVEPKAPAPVQTVPSESGAILSMIERAAKDPAVDIEKFERLMAMRERMDMRAAQIAFAAAVSEAKAKIEPITRNAKGHNEKRYADFSAIASAVDSTLSAHGLTYRFRSSQTEKSVSVTCILSHRDGHSEETTLTSAPDSSGNKNSIQAIGSALTYLQRYSLTLSLGLATTNDDDGRKAGAVEIDRDALMDEGRRVVTSDGMAALGVWWTKTLTKEHRKVLGSSALEDLKKLGEG